MVQVPELACAEALQKAVTLAIEGDVDKAAELLRSEGHEASITALTSARESVLDAALRQDKVEAAANVALEVLRSKQPLQLQSQEILLRALVSAQQTSKAVELLRAICDLRASMPGDQVCNQVLDAAVRSRSYGEAWDVLETLLNCKRKADKYFVSILTKSLESSSDKRWLRRGIALVDRFIDQQKEDVDEIVFNSLLNVLGQMQDMAKLQQTLNKMSEYGVSPSAVTFGTVVKAYGRARDIEAVLRVWNQMRTRCLGVNPVTCGCVLDACVKCGSLDKAMAIFQEMRLQGMHKNTVLYATLIKGLAKVRDLQGAWNLYQEMRVEGVPCNLVTFNSLMDVCVRCSDLQTAAFFLQDMMHMGLEPDLITFSTLIKGYSHTGEVHKALALCKELKSRGLKCDEIMYNSLIDGCAKSLKVAEGLSVFEDMLQSYVQPSNITFSILVKLHFQVGQIAEAFRLVEDMYPKYCCQPGRIVYTVLLRCCAQHGGVALAQGAHLLIDLASKKHAKMPDQVMVSSMLSACVQHGDFQTATQLVRNFSSFGNRRSTGTVGLDSLKLLFEALGSQNEALGKELLEYLRGKSLSVPHSMMLEAALTEGRHNPGSWMQRAAEAASFHEHTQEVTGGVAGWTSQQGHVVPPQFIHPAPDMLQLPPPPLSMPPANMDPHMAYYDPNMAASYLPPAVAPFALPAYNPGYNPAAAAAAAAASAAAAAAYHQSMANYAAAAAGYPQPLPQHMFPPSPQVLPEVAVSPGMVVPMTPQTPQTPMPAAPGVAYPPVPSSFLAPALATVPGSFLPPPEQLPTPKAPAAAAALALTPLPAGPLSPTGAKAGVTPPPLDKAHGKENVSKNKENDAKAKGKKPGQLTREALQTQQLRDRAAALSAVPVGRLD